ncbi:MAG: hypothetical protein WD080_02730 [Egibacteraceae bacterium]
MRPVLDVLRALHEAEVRAVVVGGVAVVLHGHPRLTADLDLVLDLASDNVTRALVTLQQQGLRPRLPVAPEQFADPVIRERWQRERDLTVFSLHDPADALREVDLLAESPVPFAELWAASRVVLVADVPVRVAGLDHLLAMKRAAGRAQDLADVAALEALRDDTGRP